MPFIPHTPTEVQAMLAAIDAPNLEALFDEIPPALRIGQPPALPRPAGEVLDGLLARGILGGFDPGGDYPELGNALLVCATETKDDQDLQRYAAALAEVV